MQFELYDQSIERAVLSALCRYGLEVYIDLNFLNVGHFYDPINQILFSCVQDVLDNNQTVEYLTIFSAAQKIGVYDAINNEQEISFIRSLFNFPVNKDNIPSFAARLVKLKLARDLHKTLDICQKTIQNITGDEELSDIVSIVEQPIEKIVNEVYKVDNNQTQLIGNDINEYVQFLEENQSDYLGLPTGMNRFDEAIGGGLRRKGVTLGAARPGIGKSVVATNIGLHLAGKCDIPVLYLDTEMSVEDQRNRALANLSGVKTNDIAKGAFANKEMQKEKIIASANKLKSMPFHYISIAGQSFDSVLNIIKRWVKNHVGADENGKTKDCLIIYDYFKLMSSESLGKALQEYQVLGFQITRMSDFCIEHDVPCLAFVQINRDGEVAQSDRLEWLASTLFILQAKSEEEIADDGEENGNRKIWFKKTRHGGGLQVGDYINIKMDGSTAKMKEWYTRNELKKNVTADSESLFEQEESENTAPF